MYTNLQIKYILFAPIHGPVHYNTIHTVCIQCTCTVRYVKYIVYITATITAFQFDGGMRLLDGPHHSQGILELYFFGQWGGVCGRSFDVIAADAACVALGYSRSRSLSFVSRYKYNHVHEDAS